MQNDIIKTSDEIALIKRAVQIIDDCYDAVLETVKGGMSEKELADFIEDFVKRHGGEGLSFDTIVAYGAGGAEPHHVPTDAKLESGMLVTIDMGAVYGGYCSDFTRTFAYGRVDEKQREVYDVVYRAQKLGVAATRAGISCHDLDAVCRNYISEKGYGDKFIHTTGHGVGKLIHEAPRVGKGDETVLENGMVITIEPGIYLPGELGVRIEDTLVVGEGALSRIPTELIILPE